MALIRLNYLSKYLLRTVDVNVILPVDYLNMDTMKYENHAPFSTLYLLHGIYGDQNDWLYGTRIQRWANEHHLCVIMPSGENMFYVDNEINHHYYSEFIGKELVEITRQMFPLSPKKEDTFIAGLSMGGYGAIVNGLKYSDTFGYIAGLSSALMIDDWINCNPPIIDVPDIKKYYESIFGDITLLRGSDKDYMALVESKSIKDIPHMYLCVGTEDFLLENNRNYYHFLQEKGVDVTYEEGPGGHEWDFWDRYIFKVLNWLPIAKNSEGLNSGHVQ
jgi:putative tributyrin esterase